MSKIKPGIVDEFFSTVSGLVCDICEISTRTYLTQFHIEFSIKLAIQS